MKTRLLAGVVTVATAVLVPPRLDRPAPIVLAVAPGVFLFQTAPYGEVGLDGNAVAIVSSDGVLVFDANGTPSAAAAVLAEIRAITPQPIRYLVTSHWHWDHWYGAEVYRAAFPDLRVIAHERTRRMMMGPALEFNRPGLERQLPDYIRGLEARVAAAEAATPPSDTLPRLRQSLADARFFLSEKTRVRHTFPDLTFSSALTLHMGGREIQVLHHDRAVTPGDAFLYLPQDRVLITGDLLVNPISYALSAYPTGWLRTLERLDAFDAAVIVPGHGEPLRDETLLHATRDVFRELLRQGKAARAKGLDPDQARAAILPSLAPLMATIAGTDPRRRAAFETQLVDWYLHRVYDELAGPLTDDIAPIPVK